MYDYLLNMWIMGMVTEYDLEVFAGDGFLTIDEFDSIVKTPQIASIENAGG